jgi:hypothetical protein
MHDVGYCWSYVFSQNSKQYKLINYKGSDLSASIPNLLSLLLRSRCFLLYWGILGCLLLFKEHNEICNEISPSDCAQITKILAILHHGNAHILWNHDAYWIWPTLAKSARLWSVFELPVDLETHNIC